MNDNTECSSISVAPTGVEDFLRVACVSPAIRVADVAFNAEAIAQALDQCSQSGAAVAVFPELSITGYTCADLFGNSRLRTGALKALDQLICLSERIETYAVVGFPFEVCGRLFNCVGLIGKGRIHGVIPKTFLPNCGEYYERRWFTSGAQADFTEVKIAGRQTPFGPNLLFRASDIEGCILGLEICEDLWAVEPPSGRYALAGATVILNSSASNELVGKAAYRRDLIRQQSARCLAAYAYAAAGPGESSTDLVFSGHCVIAESGTLLTESERFRFSTQHIFADIDLGKLAHDRLHNSSFSSLGGMSTCRLVEIPIQHAYGKSEVRGAFRPNPRSPFVPSDPTVRSNTCREVFAIQTTGLSKRLSHIGIGCVVIGVSGGLDSTLALLVAAKCFDQSGIDRRGIRAVRMPGFGTTDRTHSNAEKLAHLLGVSLRTIAIEPAIRQHFSDIEHDIKDHGVTYENSQARERTQILMDIANKTGGIVLGTGDLSEAALGWCTYNGDHMSMYHVNAGIPKTLVRYLIEWCADEEFKGDAASLLKDISDTPITPELLPRTPTGTNEQHTESIIGPYVLHDYFLFHAVRNGASPSKILHLAVQAFADSYDRVTILRWLDIFVRRFFSQQYKRSVMPDGPKVGSVCLSPRGDWRMPSDASSELWIRELETLRDQ